MSGNRFGVLFVCTGNICRSPTAEAVFRKLAAQAGLAQVILADSAGTHGYHIGEPPDPRAQDAAAKRGYDLSGLRARRFEQADFQRFDLILAMDREDRKSTRLNSSHVEISYAVFCLKKKKQIN